LCGRSSAAAHRRPSTASWEASRQQADAGYAWGKSDTEAAISDAIAGTPLVAASTSGKVTGMIYGARAGFN
jgi:hypothetical protein